MRTALRRATIALILVAATFILMPESATATAMEPPQTSASFSAGSSCAALAGTPGVHWVADFSPFTRSPSIADLPDDGYCKPGRFECRWGGDCVKKGDQCYNCIEDYHWSDGMNSCYSCGKGQQLVQNPNGEWRCQN
jgi:hypothetical protein